MNLIRKYKIYKLTGNLPSGKEGEAISFMKSILEDLTIFKHKDYPDCIYYINSEGDFIFEQDFKTNIFYIRYNNVWEVLETKYRMKDLDIQELIKYMAEEKFKHKIGKPQTLRRVVCKSVEEAYKELNNKNESNT